MIENKELRYEKLPIIIAEYERIGNTLDGKELFEFIGFGIT